MKQNEAEVEQKSDLRFQLEYQPHRTGQIEPASGYHQSEGIYRAFVSVHRLMVIFVVISW